MSKHNIAQTTRLSGAVLTLLAGSALGGELPNGVASGEVRSNSAVLWAKASIPGKLYFDYSTDPNLAGRLTVTRHATDTNLPIKAVVGGLQPDTTYYYCVEDYFLNKSCGKFRTLPKGKVSNGLVFGVLGSLDPYYQIFPGLNNLPAENPALLLDMSAWTDIFAPPIPDWTLYSEFASLYARSLSDYGSYTNAFTAARAASPVFPVLGEDTVYRSFAGGAAAGSDPRFDVTGTYINDSKRYNAAINAFRNYTPVRYQRFGNTGDPRTALKPKLQRSFQVGKDAMFILADFFSFRDPTVAPPTNPFDPAQAAAYYAQAYAPGRTAFGTQQLATIKQALLDAKNRGVRWKFVAPGGMAQDFGVFGGVQFQLGNYALERMELMSFILQNDIRNVVFLSSSNSEFMVNNLGYSAGPGLPQTQINAFEVTAMKSMSNVKRAAGNIVAQAVIAGLLTAAQQQFYEALPIAPDSDDVPNDKDDFVKAIYNQVLSLQGLDTLGLAGSSIQATLKQGDYFSATTMGWTKFEIEPGTQKLTVTAYGLPGPDNDYQANPATYVNQTPQIISQFEVLPQ